MSTLAHLRDWITASVQRPEAPDLSARQMAVLLTLGTQEGPHTVRGLASDLNVSKPAITRALDRLGDLDFARRKVDPTDRRSVHAQITIRGHKHLLQMETDWKAATSAPPTRKAASASGAAAHG